MLLIFSINLVKLEKVWLTRFPRWHLNRDRRSTCLLQSYLCSNLSFARNMARTIERIKAYHIDHHYNTSTPIRGLLLVLFLLWIIDGYIVYYHWKNNVVKFNNKNIRAPLSSRKLIEPRLAGLSQAHHKESNQLSYVDNCSLSFVFFSFLWLS